MRAVRNVIPVRKLRLMDLRSFRVRVDFPLNIPRLCLFVLFLQLIKLFHLLCRRMLLVVELFPFGQLVRFQVSDIRIVFFLRWSGRRP
jgi:hypothetical protein